MQGSLCAEASVDSNSSSFSSSCSICRSSFSDLAPRLHAPQLGDEQLRMLDLTFRESRRCCVATNSSCCDRISAFNQRHQ